MSRSLKLNDSFRFFGDSMPTKYSEKSPKMVRYQMISLI